MLIMENAVTRAGSRDDLRMFEILAAAFEADPVVRWMYPDREQYRRHFPRFAAAFAGAAIEHGTADWIEDAAAALWLPPGLGPDETKLAQVLEDSLPVAERELVFTLLEKMAHHHPQEPHWYLPLIGVAPARQRQGCGSDLLKHALRRCARDSRPAYLESTNPRNIPLYERHGFRAIGRIQVGTSPAIIPMLRVPC